MSRNIKEKQVKTYKWESPQKSVRCMRGNAVLDFGPFFFQRCFSLCVIFKSLWTSCTVSSPEFCQPRHLGLPAHRAPCLVCATAFWGRCRVCEAALCRRCLIGSCACWGRCPVGLPAWSWCCGKVLRLVETVTLGCLANFWLHRLRDVVVVAEPRGGGQSSLKESTSHITIQTQECKNENKTKQRKPQRPLN